MRYHESTSLQVLRTLALNSGVVPMHIRSYYGLRSHPPDTRGWLGSSHYTASNCPWQWPTPDLDISLPVAVWHHIDST